MIDHRKQDHLTHRCLGQQQVTDRSQPGTVKRLPFSAPKRLGTFQNECLIAHTMIHKIAHGVQTRGSCDWSTPIVSDLNLSCQQFKILPPGDLDVF